MATEDKYNETENKSVDEQRRIYEESLIENSTRRFSNIKGWGMDADPENEPTYPMKNYTGDDHNRINYTKPVQQEVNVEILHSNERPGVSAVFGTTTPPSGLSGTIRRYAFKFSESDYRHWLPLLLADRVNVIEGYIEDFKNGRIPNVFSERGWKAEWKYDRKRVLIKAAAGVVVAGAITAMFMRKKTKTLDD